MDLVCAQIVVKNLEAPVSSCLILEWVRESVLAKANRTRKADLVARTASVYTINCSRAAVAPTDTRCL